MSKSPAQATNLFISMALGLAMAVVSWIVFYISAMILDNFVLEASDSELEIASAVRTSLYLMQILFSIQVWFFSTLYFFDRYRR